MFAYLVLNHKEKADEQKIPMSWSFFFHKTNDLQLGVKQVSQPTLATFQNFDLPWPPSKLSIGTYDYFMGVSFLNRNTKHWQNKRSIQNKKSTDCNFLGFSIKLGLLQSV